MKTRILLLPVLALAGCASKGSGDEAQKTTKSTGSSGVSASGGFGEKPTLTVPSVFNLTTHEAHAVLVTAG